MALLRGPLAGVYRRRVGVPRLLRLAGAIDGPLLDVGCGSGEGTARLAARLPRVEMVAVDSSARAVENARWRLLRSVRVEEADARALPFPDASFRTVTLLAVLHHVDEPGRALAEARRVLAPRGRLLVMEYDEAVLDGPHARRHHVTMRWSRPSLREAVEAAGLVVEREAGRHLLLVVARRE